MLEFTVHIDSCRIHAPPPTAAFDSLCGESSTVRVEFDWVAADVKSEYTESDGTIFRTRTIETAPGTWVFSNPIFASVLTPYLGGRPLKIGASRAVGPMSDVQKVSFLALSEGGICPLITPFYIIRMSVLQDVPVDADGFPIIENDLSLEGKMHLDHHDVFKLEEGMGAAEVRINNLRGVPIDSIVVPVPDFGPPPSWMDTIIVDTTMVSREPLENEEAEWLALYLSRDLVAPPDFYERVKNDLQTIRTGYQDLDPPLMGRFFNYWSPGILTVLLNDEAAGRYEAGTFTDLDELNAAFQLDWINDAVFDIGNTLTLHFKGRLHPKRLAEFYESIESLDHVSVTHYGCCDGDRVYPWYAYGKLTYLFREGWGDCPAGCTYERFWYFRTDGEGAVDYVGSYTPPEGDEVPPWWPEAERNINAFYDGDW
jgi:hypothetical protein